MVHRRSGYRHNRYIPHLWGFWPPRPQQIVLAQKKDDSDEDNVSESELIRYGGIGLIILILVLAIFFTMSRK